jgi:hypothetical protein
VSQYFGFLKDAHKNDLKVPHCNTLMKDSNLERFPQLCKMQIVQKDSIWSFIDCDTCEFVHILPVLNVKHFRECSKPQKSQYLKRIAWIVIRSLLVPGTTSFYVDRYFAVSTTGCFMLHQKDSVNVKSCEYDRFKKFYGQKVDPCEALTRFFKFLDIEPVWTSHACWGLGFLGFCNKM